MNALFDPTLFVARIANLSVLLAMFASEAQGGDPPRIQLDSPRPYQVVQREGFDPRHSHGHAAGAPQMGFAEVLISLSRDISKETLDWRVVALPGSFGKGTEWTLCEPTKVDGRWQAMVHIPAGGWYRLEVRSREKEAVVSLGTVEPFGVGEVFLIAGQSYATNCNDEQMKVQDPRQRVVAYDLANDKWVVANDPQPVLDGSDGGSIWPAFGDTLAPLARVPIGFVNAAVGATSSAQWLPNGKLHPRLVAAGKRVGRFRAVLWQQGESDVIGKVATETYVQNLQTIRQAAVEAWNHEAPWLLAKSTLHPTVYNDPAGEGQIRDAIDELCRSPGFRPGPDTDILDGGNRGGAKSRRHFTGIGQRRAALLWFAAVWQELNATPATAVEAPPAPELEVK